MQTAVNPEEPHPLAGLWCTHKLTISTTSWGRRRLFSSKSEIGITSHSIHCESAAAGGFPAAGKWRTRRGRAKTHLRHILIAVAMNLTRLVSWLKGVPKTKTRQSRFAALAPTASA
ncbi:MAG: hypothetical protein KME30_03740 [Iphinoe sp. HA4291-MV1]|jgi:hypothetical protein|nr:hypothetical protein [Iphinoe sp. HA4291-MV1]